MQRDEALDGSDWDRLDRVFPIVDVPSALLMKIKARCVFDAGAITAAELDEIDRRADRTIMQAVPAEETTIQPA